MPVTERTYERVALEDDERKWELHRGRLRERPGTSAMHNRLGIDLAFGVFAQLDRRTFTARVGTARVKCSGNTFYVPDVLVIPMRVLEPLLAEPDRLEVYAEPLPFVAEIWVPATEGYDTDEKIPAYFRRGDVEIWRIDPYERTLSAWRRQSNGSYDERRLASGSVRLHALPEVTIDLNALWELG